MSKRLVKIILVFAVVAFGVVFYAMERLAHTPTPQAASPQMPVHTGSAETIANAVTVPHTKAAGESRYSQKEYLLLRKRFPPNAQAANGPLPKATLKMLARNTKDSLYQQQMWPIVKAVLYGDTRALQNTFDTGASPNDDVYLGNPDNANISLLDLAIEAGQRGVIKLLLAHDVAVNPVESDVTLHGMTPKYDAPLVTAAAAGEDDVVQLLLDHGANIEQQNDSHANHSTALAEAVGMGQVSTAYLLLSRGANVNSALGPGGTIPDYLIKYDPGQRELALRNLLIAHGATMPTGQ